MAEHRGGAPGADGGTADSAKLHNSSVLRPLLMKSIPEREPDTGRLGTVHEASYEVLPG